MKKRTSNVETAAALGLAQCGHDPIRIALLVRACPGRRARPWRARRQPGHVDAQPRSRHRPSRRRPRPRRHRPRRRSAQRIADRVAHARIRAPTADTESARRRSAGLRSTRRWPPQIDAVIAPGAAHPRARGLEDVPYEFITREQFQRRPDRAAATRTCPRKCAPPRSGCSSGSACCPTTPTSTQLLLELYGGQVAAYYQPENRQLLHHRARRAVRRRRTSSSSRTSTPTRSRTSTSTSREPITRPDRGRRGAGQLAAIEGDATLTMQQWAHRRA